MYFICLIRKIVVPLRKNSGMEINIYGAKRFGNEIIVFEEASSSSKYSEYDYIVIHNTRPDGRGNGSHDIKILHGDQSELSLPNGWKINEIRGGWSWGGKSVWLNISDQYEIERNLYIPYSNQDSLEELALNVLKKIIYITENFQNSFELLLTECRTEKYRSIDFSYIDDEGDIKKFEKNREKVLEFWSIYSQYINNPVYRKNISIEHLKQIENNVCKMMNRLMNFKFTEEK